MFQNERFEKTIVRSTSRAKPKGTTSLNRSRPLTVQPGLDELLESLRSADDHEYARNIAPKRFIKFRAVNIDFSEVVIATGELGGSVTIMNDCASNVVEVGSNMTSRYAVGDQVCSYLVQSYKKNIPLLAETIVVEFRKTSSSRLAHLYPLCGQPRTTRWSTWPDPKWENLSQSMLLLEPSVKPLSSRPNIWMP